jgi:hypothetical protein
MKDQLFLDKSSMTALLHGKKIVQLPLKHWKKRLKTKKVKQCGSVHRTLVLADLSSPPLRQMHPVCSQT